MLATRERLVGWTCVMAGCEFSGRSRRAMVEHFRGVHDFRDFSADAMVKVHYEALGN